MAHRMSMLNGLGARLLKYRAVDVQGRRTNSEDKGKTASAAQLAFRATPRRTMAALATVLPLAAMAPAAPLSGTGEALAQPVPRALLVAARAAAHPGYDRLVFEFKGALPQSRSVNWVRQVTEDASGRVVPLAGKAFLRIVFRRAAAHTTTGQSSLSGPIPTRLDLPVLRSVEPAGDFEGVLSFGVGLWQKVPFRVFTLAGPPRVVIDATVPPSAPNRLTEADNGRLVYLKVGEKTTVALRTCVSCGYSWHVSAPPAPGIVRLSGKALVALPHRAGIVGFPYESRWQLKAIAHGFTALRLYEVGPGRDAPPVALYSVRLVVR